MEGISSMSLEDVVITVSKGGELKEKFLINLPNVRSLKGYLKGFWDFDIYNDAFPRKSKLSDVDGSIELEGHTLHVEFKESKYSMNRGQVLKAVRQAKYSNITTIFVIGKTDQPAQYISFTPDDGPEGVFISGYLECSQEILFMVLKNWAEWAKDHTLVTSKTEEWNLARGI
jgi:hypothetical protein